MHIELQLLQTRLQARRAKSRVWFFVFFAEMESLLLVPVPLETWAHFSWWRQR